MTSRKPDLERALSALSPGVAAAVRSASRALRELDVRHALCGSVAVSAYAQPRASTDVDFLVGDEAFEQRGNLRFYRGPVRVGSIEIKVTSLVAAFAPLAPVLDAPEEGDAIPFLSPEALIAMRLVRRRLQDQADIVALIEDGAIDVGDCRAWLEERGFEVALFDQLAAKVGVR